MWPDSTLSFILVYAVAACCGFLSLPGLMSCTALRTPSSSDGVALAPLPYDRRSKNRSARFGGRWRALARHVDAVVDGCEAHKTSMLLVSLLSLTLTAIVCRWTWWWFHGNALPLWRAVLSIAGTEAAGYLLGAAVHLLLLGPPTSRQNVGDDFQRLRVVTLGGSPPSSPLSDAGRIV